MSERRAFIRAILEDPDDDTHRLVCADWLEENGDPVRAEFIRAQVELARVVPAHPQHARFVRQQQVLDSHGRRWLEAVQRESWASVPVFERGFLKSLRLLTPTQADELVERAAEMFDTEPILELDLTYGPQRLEAESLARLAAVRELAWVRRLSLTRTAVENVETEGLMEDLLTSPHWERLAGLRLDHFDAGIARALSRSPLRAAFRNLDFNGCVLTASSLEALLDASLTSLFALHLAGRRVSRLEVRAHRSVRSTQPCIGEAGVIRLAGWQGLAQVEVLDLRWNGLGDAGIQALVRSPYLGRLRLLRMYEANDSTTVFGQIETPNLPLSLAPGAVEALRERFGNRVRFEP
jgi:uncharacterized protein (TIGR02996 family)